MLHHIFQKVLLPAALAGTMLAGTSAPAVSLAAQAATQPDSYHDDWLHVNDNAEIVDKDGNPVWITGCNWFGYNVGSQVFDGVWSQNMHDMLRQIADHGFNFLRIPMSTEILLQWKNGDPDPATPKVNQYTNPELTEEGIDFKGMKMVLIGTGGAATAIAVRGALDGVAEIEIFNIKDKFYSRGEEIVDLINKNTNCKATMNDLADKDLLKEKMHAADLFCDATGVGMHPLEDLSNIPDPSFFKKDLIVTDTVYAPRETVMMKQAKEAGCEKVFNGMGMMLFQALITIKLYTGKDTPVDYMKEKLGI